MYSLLHYIQAEFVMIKLRVISKDAPQEDIADGVSGQCTCTKALFFLLFFAFSY